MLIRLKVLFGRERMLMRLKVLVWKGKNAYGILRYLFGRERMLMGF